MTPWKSLPHMPEQRMGNLTYAGVTKAAAERRMKMQKQNGNSAEKVKVHTRFISLTMPVGIVVE